MSRLEFSSAMPCHEQVYLLERDSGLLCRILGLYAARSLDVLHVDYAYAAQEVMKLRVRVGERAAEASEVVDSVRVLVAKASTFVGVIVAVEHSDPHSPGLECLLPPNVGGNRIRDAPGLALE